MPLLYADLKDGIRDGWERAIRENTPAHRAEEGGSYLRVAYGRFKLGRHAHYCRWNGNDGMNSPPGHFPPLQKARWSGYNGMWPHEIYDAWVAAVMAVWGRTE